MLWTEAAQSIRGAWRLALLDPAGMGGFNLSEQGFWRSFLVYVYLAPVYLLMVLLPLQGTPAVEGIEPGTLLSAKMVAYGVDIVGSTVLMAALCHLMAAGEGFAPLVIARNWSQVIQFAVMLPVALLSSKGLLAGKSGTALEIFLFVALLFYSWFIIRTALGVGALAAFGIAWAAELADEVVNLGVNWMFGIGYVQP